MAAKLKARKKKPVFDPFRRIAKYTTAVRDCPTAPSARAAAAAAIALVSNNGETNNETEESVYRFEDSALLIEPALPNSDVQLHIRWRCGVALHVNDVVTIYLPGFSGGTRMFALQEECIGGSDDEDGGSLSVATERMGSFASYFQSYWAGEEKNNEYTSWFGKPGKNGVPARCTLTLRCVRPIEPNVLVVLVTPLSLNLRSPDKLSACSTKVKIEARLGGHSDGKSDMRSTKTKNSIRIRKQPFARCTELRKRSTAEELALLEEYMSRVAECAGLTREERHIAEELNEEEMFYMTESVTKQRQLYSLTSFSPLRWLSAMPIFTRYEACGSLVKLVMESVLRALREREADGGGGGSGLLGLHREVARNWNVKVGTVVLFEELLALHTAGLYRGLSRGSLLACRLYTMEPADVVRCFPTVQIPAYSIKRELESAFRCYYTPVETSASGAQNNNEDAGSVEPTMHGSSGGNRGGSCTNALGQDSEQSIDWDHTTTSTATAATAAAAAASSASYARNSPSSDALRSRAEALVKKWPYLIAALLTAQLRVVAVCPPGLSNQSTHTRNDAPSPDCTAQSNAMDGSINHSGSSSDVEHENNDCADDVDECCADDVGSSDDDGEEREWEFDEDQTDSAHTHNRRRLRGANAPRHGQAVIRGPLPPLYVGVREVHPTFMHALQRLSARDWLMLPGFTLAREDSQSAAATALSVEAGADGKAGAAARMRFLSTSSPTSTMDEPQQQHVGGGDAVQRRPAAWAASSSRHSSPSPLAGSSHLPSLQRKTYTSRGHDVDKTTRAQEAASRASMCTEEGGAGEARERVVIFELHGVCEAVELADVSSYPYNREWLLPFGSTFRVRRVRGPSVPSTTPYMRTSISRTSHRAALRRKENDGANSSNNEASDDCEDDDGDGGDDSSGSGSGSSSASWTRISLTMIGSLIGSHTDPHIPASDRSVLRILQRKLQSEAVYAATQSCAVAQLMLCHAQRQSRRRRYPPTALLMRYQDNFAAVRWTSEALQRVEGHVVRWEQCTRAAERLAEGVVAPALWESVARKYAVGLEQLFVRRQRLAGRTSNKSSSSSNNSSSNGAADSLDGMASVSSNSGWTVNWLTWTWEVMGGKGVSNVGPRPIRRRVGRCITHEPSLLRASTIINHNNSNSNSTNYESIEELQEQIQITSATLAGLETRLGMSGTGNAASLGSKKSRAEVVKKAEVLVETAAQAKKTTRKSKKKKTAA